MLVITLGDPLSINIRIINFLLNQRLIGTTTTVLVGSKKQWDYQVENLPSPAGLLTKNAPSAFLDFTEVDSLESFRKSLSSSHLKNAFYFWNLDSLVESETSSELVGSNPQSLSQKLRGRISYVSLKTVEKLTAYCEERAQKLAVLTSPIDKHAISLAGFGFPGQTEYFESIWQSEAIMVLGGPRLRVGLVTNHLALSEVSAALSENVIEKKCQLFADTLVKVFGARNPKIAICGLNPHCSDQGLFGNEEAAIILPALAKLQQKGYSVKLCPADTAFYFAYQGQFDGVLAMYHDQGLGPLKTVHFDTAVNVSGGLKHLRVSPDHGPAADKITSQNISTASFEAALEHCMNYLGNS